MSDETYDRLMKYADGRPLGLAVERLLDAQDQQPIGTAVGSDPHHAFRPQKGNTLRCDDCGNRKADH